MEYVLHRANQARSNIVEKYNKLSKTLGRPVKILVVTHKIFSVVFLSKQFKALKPHEHISQVPLGCRNFPLDGVWMNNVEAINADEYIF